MDAALFLTDLEQKPEQLGLLADAIDAGWPAWPARPATTHGPGHDVGRRRVLLTGMGSSLFAAQVAALRCRVAGITAIGESASSDATLTSLTSDDIVVAISAGGESPETKRLVDTTTGAYRIAITNTPGSAITAGADHVVDLRAGPERGGVACRSFTHTLVALLSLQQHLASPDLTSPDLISPDPGSGTFDLAARVRAAADATAHLLDTRDSWLAEATTLLAGPHGSWLLAPVERLSSAQQGALMLREGPRRPAVGCETGDWSHVDVYLTKTLDYRALVFTGSRGDSAAADWMSERQSTVVAVGGDFAGAALTIRHPGDDDPLVRLLVETTVPELIAARLWR